MGSIDKMQQSTTVPPKLQVSNKIRVSNLPINLTKSDAHTLMKDFGTVKYFEFVLEPNRYCEATFASPQEAMNAVDHFQKNTFQGLEVNFVNSTTNRFQKYKGRSVSANNINYGARPNNHPLRILVPSSFVGAIIGKKGESIKGITTRCKARIDVRGKDMSGFPEKIITIYGQPDNCSKACKEILNVIQHEMASGLCGDISLKMLAEDQYCGRLIGKSGRIIKKIKEDTGTKIVVTDVKEEMKLFYPDRVISIRGDVDGMVQAEAALLTRLNECIERDSAKMMYPNVPGMGASRQNGYLSPLAMNSMYGQYEATTPQFGVSRDKCQLTIPNSAVGAIIGTAGVNVKKMMRDSGAIITVEKWAGDLSPSSERIVSLMGDPRALYNATFFIFDKLRLEGFFGHNDPHLKMTIFVPTDFVGRLIGKGGKNIREVQRLTGAVIKVPSLHANQVGDGADKQMVNGNGEKALSNHVDENKEPTSHKDTTVDLIGSFYAVTNAQYQIQRLINILKQPVLAQPQSTTYKPRPPTHLQPRI